MTRFLIEQHLMLRLTKILRLKLMAVLTATVFLGSTLCAPMAEANFWQDRKLALRKMQSGETGEETVSRSDGKLYAQLPLPVTDQIGRALPAPAQLGSLRGFTSAAAVSKTPPQWPAWLPPIPSAYGDIRSVNILNGSQKPLVIIIQDAHDIYSAQLNISRMLAHINDASERPIMVGVEGSEGAFDLVPFRDTTDAERQEAVSNFLLQQGLILGTEHFAITSTNEPFLWGVEEPSLYVRNVQAYRDTIPLKTGFEAALHSLDESIKPLKDRVFSLKLWALDQHLSAYHKGNEDLLSFINFLVGASQRTGLSDGAIGAGENVSMEAFGEVEKFSRALEMEKSLDFARVTSERLAFIQELSRRVSDRDLNDLLNLSLDFRAGRLDYKSYYGSLTRLAGNNNLPLERYSSLDAYIRYGLIADSINRHKLFDQVEGLKDAVTENLSTTEEQMELCRMGEDLRLLDRLMRQEFGPAEWRAYSRRKSEIASLATRATDLASKVGVSFPDPENSLTELLPAFENFYIAADERNEVLVSNLLNKLQSGSSVAVMVAGGFHTESLEKIFAEKGLSTITLTPNMETVETKGGSKYLDAFAMNRTPLEKLLLGEKLDLNTPAAACLSTRRGDFGAISIKAEHAGTTAATAYVAAKGDSRAVARLARDKNAAVSQFEMKGPFAGFKLKFTDGTTVTVGAALLRTGQIVDEARNALERFLSARFSGIFSHLNIVLNTVISGGDNKVLLMAGGSAGGISGLPRLRDSAIPREMGESIEKGFALLVLPVKWEIISLALLLIASTGGFLSPPIMALLALAAVLRPFIYVSVAAHGLGHALSMAFFDNSKPFLNSVKNSMSSYMDDFSFSKIPSMKNVLTDKNAVRVTALMGPVMTSLLAFAVAPGLAALIGPSFAFTADILKSINILLVIISISDILSVFSGVALNYNCGNFGILAKRVASDVGLLPSRIETMWTAMGSQTDVRGQQAGGPALLTQTKKGAVFVGTKIVNRKRDNLTRELMKQFKIELNKARRSSKPFDGFIHLITHYRYGTSSAPAVIETHWHRWLNPRTATVWALRNGALVQEKQNVDNLITHNGDFDYWRFPWGADELVAENGDIGVWLAKVLGGNNPAKGDSPKIAGMMDLLLTQGQWEASLRLAYVMHKASSLEEIPDAQLLKNLSALFEEKFKARMAALSVADGTSLSDVPRLHAEEVARLSEEILSAIAPQTRSWTDQQRKAFVEGAVDYFFRNDLFAASKLFMSRAVGSFGLITTSTLAPGQIVMNCYKQPLSIGVSPKAGLMVYASEPTALKAAAASLGGVSEIPYRYDMRDNELAMLEVAEGETANRVTVYNQKDGGTTVYDITEENLAPEERWVDVRNNPYISPFKYTTPKDRVKEEMDDIPRVLETIERNWSDPNSLNRQTAEEFTRALKEKAEIYARERNREAIDLLILGQENSLYIGEGFANAMAKAFPFMNIRVVDSGAFARDPESFAIDPRTVVLGVSQSGQTFNTLDSVKFLQELNDAGKCGEVFVMTGEMETLMGAATGQSFRADAPFKKRIFSNMSGWRMAEPSTVTAAAAFITLNHILMQTLETMRNSFGPDENPFGMVLSPEDLSRLRLLNQEVVERAESIVGKTKNGAEVKSSEHAELVKMGGKISNFVTEGAISSVLTMIHLFITLALHQNPVTLVFSLLPNLPGMDVISAAMQTAYYVLAPIVFFLLIRWAQGRPILDRVGPRSIVIKDESTVALLTEAYLSKLFSLSYGVATFAGIHGADNQSGDALHRFGHRVQRGTLIVHGIPDGRLKPVATTQAGAAMTSKQAQGVQNLGTGAYVMGIGANPSMAQKFNRYVQLDRSEGTPLPINPALGHPEQWSGDLQSIVESRIGSFERLLAFYVTFHETAASTARLINILPIFVRIFGRPILWALKKITFGRVDVYIGPWEPARTQSGTRIATTADPVPAILLSSADFESRPLRGSKEKIMPSAAEQVAQFPFLEATDPLRMLVGILPAIPGIDVDRMTSAQLQDHILEQISLWLSSQDQPELTIPDSTVEIFLAFFHGYFDVQNSQADNIQLATPNSFGTSEDVIPLAEYVQRLTEGKHRRVQTTERIFVQWNPEQRFLRLSHGVQLKKAEPDQATLLPPVIVKGWLWPLLGLEMEPDDDLMARLRRTAFNYVEDFGSLERLKAAARLLGVAGADEFSNPVNLRRYLLENLDRKMLLNLADKTNIKNPAKASNAVLLPYLLNTISVPHAQSSTNNGLDLASVFASLNLTVDTTDFKGRDAAALLIALKREVSAAQSRRELQSLREKAFLAKWDGQLEMDENKITRANRATLRKWLRDSTLSERSNAPWHQRIKIYLLRKGIPQPVLDHVTENLRKMRTGIPAASLNGYHETIEPDLQSHLLAQPQVFDLVLQEFGITLADQNQRAAAVEIFVQSLIRRPAIFLPYVQRHYPTGGQTLEEQDYITLLVEALLLEDDLRDTFLAGWLDYLELMAKAAALNIAIADADVSPMKLRDILENEWRDRLLNLLRALDITWIEKSIPMDSLLGILDQELRKPGDHTWTLTPLDLETLLRVLSDKAILQEKDGQPMAINDFLSAKQTFRLTPRPGAETFRLEWNPRENLTGEKQSLRYQNSDQGMVLMPRYSVPEVENKKQAFDSPANMSNITTETESKVELNKGGRWPLFEPLYSAAAVLSPSFGYVFLPTLLESLLPVAGLTALLLNLFLSLSTALPAFAAPFILVAVYPATYLFVGLWVRLHGAETSAPVRTIAARTKRSLLQAFVFTAAMAIVNPATLPVIAPLALLLAVSLPHINVNFAALPIASPENFETALNSELGSTRQRVQAQILKALSGERLGSLLQFRRRYDSFDKNSLRSRILSGSDGPEALFGERFNRAFTLSDSGVQFRSTLGEFILAAFGGTLPVRNNPSADRDEAIELTGALASLGKRGAFVSVETAGLIRAAEKFKPLDTATPFESGTVLIVNFHKPDAHVLKNLSALLDANGENLRVILATGEQSLAQLKASHPELDLSSLNDPRVVPVETPSVRLAELMESAGVPVETVQRLRILEAVDAGTPWDMTDLPDSLANAIEVILSIMEGMSLTAPLRDTTNFATHLRAFITAA